MYVIGQAISDQNGAIILTKKAPETIYLKSKSTRNAMFVKKLIPYDTQYYTGHYDQSCFNTLSVVLLTQYDANAYVF